MNPLLAIKAGQTAKNVVSHKAFYIPVIILVLLLLSKKTVKAAIKQYKEKKFDKNETEDVNQIAQQYRSVSNPSGINFLIDADGSDEEGFKILAHRTKGNFKQVAEAYKLKFDETLTDRVRSELDSEDYQNWLNIIQ